MTQRTTFLAYARKSRIDANHRKEIESTDRQIARLRAWAAEQGCELELYAEPDGFRSGGSTAHRPAYRQMLHRIQTARPGEIAGIVATELDRAGRLERDMHELFDEVVTRGLRLIVLDDPSLNLESTDGRFLAGLKVLLAAQERRRVSDRLKRASAYRMSLGLYAGGSVYGYRWSTVTNEQGHAQKLLTPEPVEAERIVAILERYVAGHGSSAIARWANALGWPSPRGKAWGASTILDIIDHHMLYRGYVVTREGDRVTGTIEGRHAAIIDEALATAVQRARQGRSPSSSGGRRDGTRFPLAHRIYCAECGSSLVGNTRYNEGREVRYFYQCTKQRPCRQSRVDALALERELLRELDRFFTMVRWHSATVPEPAPLVPRPLPEPTAVGTIRAEMARLNSMFQKGRISEAQYDRDYEELERKLQLASATAETVGSASDPYGLALLGKVLGDAQPAALVADRDRVRQIVEALVERVIVEDGRLKDWRLIPPLEAVRETLLGQLGDSSELSR